MWERINQNSNAQQAKKRGRVVYDPQANKTDRGKCIPFRYEPDRATYRTIKRALIKEHNNQEE